MFDTLQGRIEKAFKNLKGQGRITESNVADTIKEIRRALIAADVNFKVAKTFTDEIIAKAKGAEVIKSVSPGQQLTKIVNDELVKLLGGSTSELQLKGSPAVILIAGLQGSGKTTFTGKLSRLLKAQGRNPMVVAGDVYRPAAREQLRVLAEQTEVAYYTENDNNNPVKIAENAIREAKIKNYNVVIVDTAGRIAIDTDMMNEIAALKKALNPIETLFVVDAMTGQDAVNTAKAFNDVLDFTGVVLTKLDGDARGGAALSIKSVVNKPIKFASRGEKMDALDVFHPDRMAGRILGMGASQIRNFLRAGDKGSEAMGKILQQRAKSLSPDELAEVQLLLPKPTAGAPSSYVAPSAQVGAQGRQAAQAAARARQAAEDRARAAARGERSGQPIRIEQTPAQRLGSTQGSGSAFDDLINRLGPIGMAEGMSVRDKIMNTYGRM